MHRAPSSRVPLRRVSRTAWSVAPHWLATPPPPTPPPPPAPPPRNDFTAATISVTDADVAAAADSAADAAAAAGSTTANDSAATTSSVAVAAAGVRGYRGFLASPGDLPWPDDNSSHHRLRGFVRHAPFDVVETVGVIRTSAGGVASTPRRTRLSRCTNTKTARGVSRATRATSPTQLS